MNAENKEVRIRVAGLLVGEEGILLVRHEKKGKTYWLAPGGGVEYGETLEQALRREFEEELKLKIEVGPAAFMHDSVPPDFHRHVVNVYFHVSAKEKNFLVQPDGVLRQARFHALEGLEALVLYPPVAREIRRAVEKKRWLGYFGNRWEA